MSINQLSIFVENKAGRLANISEVLFEANIDIRAISIADTSDFGILRLIVDNPDKAVSALKNANIAVSVTSVIAIGINDKPGEFYKAIRLLADEGIGIEYMYAFISREENKAFVILRINEENRALEILQQNGISILTAEQLHNM